MEWGEVLRSLSALRSSEGKKIKIKEIFLKLKKVKEKKGKKLISKRSSEVMLMLLG